MSTYPCAKSIKNATVSQYRSPPSNENQVTPKNYQVLLSSILLQSLNSTTQG